MKGLTERQSELLTFIDEYIKTRGFSPSYREIMAKFDLSSVGTVYNYIKILKRKGLISSEKHCGRSLVLNEQLTQTEVKVPFIGHIAAGAPIETFSQIQDMAVPKSFVRVPERTYILQAKDDTLTDELILEGDYLIVEARQNVHSGDTVVGILSHHDTIVKKYFLEGEYVRLAGHNPHQKPILLRSEELQIQGVLIGLLRIF